MDQNDMSRAQTQSQGMSQFWRGFCLGFAWPIHLLSIRRIRKGEKWSVNGVMLQTTGDFTRWNSIRWRWLWWLASIPAYCQPKKAANVVAMADLDICPKCQLGKMKFYAPNRSEVCSNEACKHEAPI